MKKAYPIIISTLLAFGLLYFLWANIFSPNNTFTLSSFSWPIFVFVFGLYIVVQGAKTLRFHFFLGQKIGFTELFSITALHSFWNNILPFRSGELSYLYLIKKTGKVPGSDNVTSLVLSRFFDFIIAPFLLLIPSFFLFSRVGNISFTLQVSLTLGIAIFLIFILAGLLIFNSFFIDVFKNAALRFRGQRLAKLFEKAAEVTNSLNHLRHFNNLVSFLFFSLLIWTSDVLFVWLALKAAGVSLGFWQAIFIDGFPAIATLLPIQAPAGAGTFEGTILSGLLLLGIKGTQAFSAGILLHLQILFSSSLLALLAFFYRKRQVDAIKIPAPKTHTEFYQALEHPEGDFRNVNLADLLLSYARGRTLLDLGSGYGLLLSLAKRRGFEVKGVEPDHELVSLSKKMYPNIPVAENTLETFETAERFDTVILADVLECLQDDESALRQARSFLKPEGQLIIAAPAYAWLFGSRDKMLGYLRRYNRAKLLEMTRKCGFEIEDVRYWNMISVLPYLLLYKILKRESHFEKLRGEKAGIGKIFTKLLSFWFRNIENGIRGGFGLSLIVVAKRKEVAI